LPYVVHAFTLDDRPSIRKFLDVPVAIYADDPAWVQPLYVDQLEKLSVKHPYFEHAQARFWIIFKNDEMIGRISAQIDQLNALSDHQKIGCIGNFECIDDQAAANRLFSEAEQWLRAHSCEIARGPFNLSINQECGLLIDGFEQPPCIMMGHARPYYQRLYGDGGYTKAKDLVAWWHDKEFVPSNAMARVIDRYQKQITIRNVDPKHSQRDIYIMREIFNDAWIDNWGYIPFTDREFEHLGKEMMQFFPARYFKIAEYRGQPVGLMALLPNINELIADLKGKLFPFGWAKLLWRMKFSSPKTGRAALLGIKRDYQNQMSSSAMVFMLIDQLREEGLKDGIVHHELSWVLEDNHRLNKIIESFGSVPYKTYRIFEKQLTSA